MNLMTFSAFATERVLTVGQFAFLERVHEYPADMIDEKENAYIPLDEFHPEARRLFKRFNFIDGNYARIPKSYYAKEVESFQTESGKTIKVGDKIQLFYGWGSGKAWFKTQGVVIAVFESNLAIVQFRFEGGGWFGTNWGTRIVDDVFHISDRAEAKQLYASFNEVSDVNKRLFYDKIKQLSDSKAIVALPVDDGN